MLLLLPSRGNNRVRVRDQREQMGTSISTSVSLRKVARKKSILHYIRKITRERSLLPAAYIIRGKRVIL